MYKYEGRQYYDDRIFVLDFIISKEKGEKVWALLTRRNCENYHIRRINVFHSKEEAIEYIKEVEPTTPRISLDGKIPDNPLTYDDYCKLLKKTGHLSAIEIHKIDNGGSRNHSVKTFTAEDMKKFKKFEKSLIS